MFKDTAATRMAGAGRRSPANYYDLGTANRDHVIEIRTTRTVYRISMRTDSQVTATEVKNVTLTSNHPGRDEGVRERISRFVHLGERLPYGSSGEMSAVQSVYVGGVRVLG